MVNHSLEHPAATLKLDITLLDSLSESINKVCALAFMATGERFLECDESIADHYLWVLGDYADKAKIAGDELCKVLGEFLRSTRQAAT